MLKSRDAWKVKDALRDMTWKERIDYIWSYFHVHILSAVAVLALVIAFLSVALAPKKQVVYSGMTVNVTLTAAGEKYLTDQLFVAFGGTDENKQEIQFQQSTMGKTEYGDTTGAEIMTLVGEMAAQAIDYLIMDELSMTYLSQGGWFGNIEEELSESQKEAFADALYKVQMEDGQIVAVAVEITDTDFIRDCAPKAKKVYLVLPGNTERAELSDDFFDWLLAWRAEE
jgi:hypothetical protein